MENRRIYYLKNIATSQRMKVHAERLKLESELPPSECQNLRAYYPIKIPESEF